MKDKTIAIHGGFYGDKEKKVNTLPIYQTTAYTFDNAEHAAKLFSLEQPGYIYTRLNNPTNAALEERMALLDGGVGALVTSSGMAAITCAILNITKQGDEIVCASTVYGGTYTLLNNTLSKYGIKTIFVEPDDFDGFEKAITPKTKLVFGESIANPKINIFDIERVAKIAHNHNIPLIIDNTVPTPALLKPIDFGADIVVYSATKYIGGHGNSMGGIIVDSGKFNWDNGKFPELTEPDESYHGVKYVETFKNAAYIVKARVGIMRDMGACLSPFNSYLIAQGIETLHIRMKEYCENAMSVAKFLDKHDKVTKVFYPALENHEYNELAKKYMPNGISSMLGFEIKGGKEAGIKFIENLKLFSHVTNLGDTKSIVTHPASTTHQQLSDEALLAAGISPSYIRLSVGLEDIEDIIDDLSQALDKC